MTKPTEKSHLDYPIHFMMASGEFRDEHQAVEVLKASLQALRDRLPKVKAYNLGVRLPESIRHFYFEGWHNGQRQAESVNKSEFLAEVEEHLEKSQDWSLDELVPVALKAVLMLIKDDEAAQVKEAVPVSMRDIFDPTQTF
jgi:uncharacterized protein (DUF2267 family)